MADMENFYDNLIIINLYRMVKSKARLFQVRTNNCYLT